MAAAWQLELMKEREDEKAWEELNKENPHLLEAAAHLKKAIQTLIEAESSLISTAEAVEEYPVTDKIMSIVYDLNNIEHDLNRIKADL